MDGIALTVECAKSKKEVVISLYRKDYQTKKGLVACWSTGNEATVNLRIYTKGNSDIIGIEDVYKGDSIETTEKEIIRKFKKQLENSFAVEAI